MPTHSSGLIDSPSPVRDSQSANREAIAAQDDPRLMKLMKCLDRAEQQVKYLHLQAEVDSLLQQLQSLKAQRSASGNPNTDALGN
jgi:hypothetical protein